MESRFGLRHVVLAVLMLIVSGLVVLGMVQQDRVWREVRDLRATTKEQASLLAELEKRLNARSEDTPSALDAWARPGVPVTRPHPWSYASNPAQDPAFQAGGTLTEILEGTPPKLTPYLNNDVFSARIINDAVCEQLAAYDARTLEYRALLAEAWQYDPAGQWLRVKIDDRARFSDGSPVTAEDVRYTVMDYVLNKELETGAFSGDLASIESVAIIADKVAEFHFREARSTNLRTALRNVILPRSYYSGFTPGQINNSTGLLMGSGPYRFENPTIESQWKPPREVVLVRNERYWRGAPPIERLRFTFIPDNGARLAAFENGDGDIMRATPDQYRRKSQDPAFNENNTAIAWTNMRAGYAFIAWNESRNAKPTPFADARVRRAMTLMLDRERINRDFYDGLATIPSGPFPPNQGDPKIQPWPFDIDKARWLLAEAGWQDRDQDGSIENSSGEPFVFELTSPIGSTIGEKVGPYLVDQAAKLGIKVALRTIDPSAFAAVRAARDFDALPMQWSWAAPEYDPFQAFHSSQAGGGDNFIEWRNSEADSLIEEARRTIDDAQRVEFWRRFHQIVHEEQPYTFLVNQPWLRFVSKRVGNVHPYPIGLDRREFFIKEAP